MPAEPSGQEGLFYYNSRGELLQSWGDTTYPSENVHDNTVFSLHSDSPFLTPQKLDQRLSRPWLESRYSQLFSTNFRTSWESRSAQHTTPRLNLRDNFLAGSNSINGLRAWPLASDSIHRRGNLERSMKRRHLCISADVIEAEMATAVGECDDVLRLV